jgi:hypothetical protein
MFIDLWNTKDADEAGVPMREDIKQYMQHEPHLIQEIVQVPLDTVLF